MLNAARGPPCLWLLLFIIAFSYGMDYVENELKKGGET